MILIPKLNHIVEATGTLSIVHTRDGELIEDRFYSNIVTTIGKKWLAARMKDTVVSVHTIPGQMSHMAIGGNSTPGTAVSKTTPLAADTTLSNLTGPTIAELARVSLTTAGGAFPQGYSTTSPSTDSLPTTSIITYAATFGAGTGTGALVEAGIFNAATNGTMLCKTSFDVVNKQANDTVAVSWTINIQ